MNAYIHPIDRVEAARITERPPGLLRRAAARLFAVIRESRDRQALAHLSEWNEHMLRDIGLTREDVRPRPRGRLSDGRWLVDQTRLTER